MDSRGERNAPDERLLLLLWLRELLRIMLLCGWSCFLFG
jgi:hypothetical protein